MAAPSGVEGHDSPDGEVIMMKKIFKSVLSFLVLFFLWITILELAADFYIKKWGDPLDRAKQILVADQNLGWRLKSNFNGKFLGKSLQINELGLRNKSVIDNNNRTINILILGPSSSFGWGIENHQTYSYLLEKLLQEKFPDLNMNVINAGQIGFSSYQGVKFYKEELVKKIKADIVIIAYGVNDVDRYRFFYTSLNPDKEEFFVPKKSTEVNLQNNLKQFNSINLLARFIYKLVDRFLNIQKSLPERRISDDDFKNNILELIKEAKENDSEIILLTTPYKLPSFNNYPEQKIQETKRIANDVDKINNIVRDIGSEQEIVLVDAAKLLKTGSESELFIDPIHFSPKGNEKLAESLYSVILENNLLKFSN